MATRNLVINDPVGIHARPAAQFAQAVTASNCNVTIAKEGGDAVPAGSILSIMGLGIKQGDTVVINVEGTDADACADKLIGILANAAGARSSSSIPCSRPPCSTGGCSILERSRRSRMATGIARRIANRTA